MTHMRDRLPHKGLEAWKWSDLRGVVGEAPIEGLEDRMKLRLWNYIDFSDGPQPAPRDDAMGQISSAFGGDAISYVVPEGAQPESPLELSQFSAGNVRIRVELKAGARLQVREGYGTTDGGFSNVEITYVVHDGAELDRIVTTAKDIDPGVLHVRAHVTLWNDAKFNQTQLTFGGKFTRLETRIACMGAVEVEMSGAYLLDGKRHADMTNYIDFAAPGSTVRDAVAGVVTDASRGVFQGKFHVRRPAQETDAEMRHDALMLSDRAKVNAKPELEIYADDVECAHGNTVGQLDESALFYMRQRGIPLGQARAMLLEAFVVARLGDDEAMAEQVRGWLEARA